MYISERAQANSDAFILRRAAHVLHKHSRKKNGYWLRVLMITLIRAAREIEKRETKNENS